MRPSFWPTMICIIVLLGVILGASPCRALVLPIPEAAGEDCCEESARLDLCGDYCPGCSERALTRAAGSTAPDHDSGVDRPVVAILPLGLPHPVSSPASPTAGARFLPALAQPTHLATTVLLR